MTTKITRNTIESYLNCRNKVHLQLTGQHGTPSDYGLLVVAARDEVRRRALDQILTRHPAEDVERDVPLTLATLQRGAPYLLNVTLEDDHLALAFDGLRRVPGRSKLGDFHYVPVLVHETGKIGKEQRLLLEVYGFLLTGVQGRAPGSGVVWHGKDCRTTNNPSRFPPRGGMRPAPGRLSRGPA